MYGYGTFVNGFYLNRQLLLALGSFGQCATELTTIVLHKKGGTGMDGDDRDMGGRLPSTFNANRLV